MMQPNEKETQKDLVLYRIETSKSDIKAAEILLAARESGVESMDFRFVIEKSENQVNLINGVSVRYHLTKASYT